jgi:hypothetical protein
VSLGDATSPPRTSLLTALRAPVGALEGTVAAAVVLAGLALLLAGPVTSAHPATNHVFRYLFDRNEPAAAWLALAIVVVAFVLARSPAFPERPAVARLAADPRGFILAVTVVLAACSLLVYRAHPLSMDEYAPLFQARVFARGQLHAQVPPELVPRLVPASVWFIEGSPSGALLSSYWPGFALLLAPFSWLGCPWLLNPLLGGATLLLVFRVARKLWPETAAPGWAVLFTAASPAFSANAISYYSMNAHLTASLGFALLLLEDRLLLAGAFGSLALALHNPFPHTLFAIPWIAWIARRPGRARNLTRLALGYAPGLAVLVAGWMWYRASVILPVQSTQRLLFNLEAIARLAFGAPSLERVLDRTMNLTQLASWAVPVLLPLAVLGAVRCRASVGARLIALSALSTLLGYAVVTYDQGHGWGFRYFHAAWAALPLLAAGALEEARATPALRKLAAVAAICSLALCTPLRFGQMRTFIDSHLAQVPEAGPGREVVFLDIRRGSYTIDLVQNDPFLDGARWILISRGEREDTLFMSAHFPNARRTHTHVAGASPLGSVWQVD